MRRLVSLVILSGFAVAGCGADSPKPQPIQLPKVIGQFGQRPVIEPGRGTPPRTLESRTLSEGHGRTAVPGNLLVVHYLGQTWREPTPFDESFRQDHPLALTLGAHQVIDGWEEKLTGAKAGSRVELSIPPAKAYGPQGHPPKIRGDDTLLFVVDVLGVYDKTDAATGRPVKVEGAGLPKVTGAPGARPTVQPASPGSKPPTTVVTKTVAVGDGPPVRPGQVVVQQIMLQRWGAPKPIAATWDEQSPVAAALGDKELPSGWEEALVGSKIGSRLLVVIPPAKGFGKTGNSQLGIKPNETMVLVLDVLGAF